MDDWSRVRMQGLSTDAQSADAKTQDKWVFSKSRVLKGMTERRNSTSTMFYSASSEKEKNMERNRKKKIKEQRKMKRKQYTYKITYTFVFYRLSLFFCDLRFVRFMTLSSRKTIPSSRDPEEPF